MKVEFEKLLRQKRLLAFVLLVMTVVQIYLTFSGAYDTFSGIVPAPAFHAALSSVTESYADRFGFYVYDSDHAELLPMDAWLRKADLSKPYYMGSVMDYSYFVSIEKQTVRDYPLCCKQKVI